MVIGKAKVHHRTNYHLSVFRNNTVGYSAYGKDAGLGGIEYSGKGIDLKHSEIGNSEAAARHIVGSKSAVSCPFDKGTAAL